jgi:uncharacterized protein YxjI
VYGAGPFAVASKRFFSLTSAFDLEDTQHQLLAKASARFFSWGTAADVSDAEGIKIGWIEEEVFRIIPWAEYRVFNSANQMVAIAKMNFFGTEFELYPPDNRNWIYATISRPFFRCCRDEWTVTIKDRPAFEEGLIDPRLLVILAIYQSDKDNRARYQQAVIDQLAQDNEGRGAY